MTGPVESPTSVDVAAAPAPTSAFMPVLILGLVMLAWFAFQALQMRSERAAMREILANQEQQMQEAKKVRDAFDSLVRGTAALAADGNPGARQIVDDLRNHGVPIPPARAASSPDDRSPK